MEPDLDKAPPPKSAAALAAEAAASARIAEALALHNCGALTGARDIYRRVLKDFPDHFDALHLLGVIALHEQNFAEAAALISKALASIPIDAVANFNYAVALTQLQQFDAALAAYNLSIQFNPRNAEAYNNRGHILWLLKRNQSAVEDYDKALALNPDYVEAYNNRGVALAGLGQYDAALISYAKAIAIKGATPEALNNRGNALQDLRRYDAALAAYDAAIALTPDYAEAHNNRGLVLAELNLFDDALAAYDRALQLKAAYAEAHNNRGNVLAALKKFQAARDSYDAALNLKPDFAEAHHNRGAVLAAMKLFGAALGSYDIAFRLKPNYPFLHGTRLYLKMLVCDWKGFDRELADLTSEIMRGDAATPSFPLLALTDSLPVQRHAAEIWAKAKHAPAAPPMAAHTNHRKIRIGYFSMDFRNHPVSTLLAGLFKAHDRDAFEVFAFSYGPDTGDHMRLRVERAVDTFFDVRLRSDRDVVALARSKEIDIAIDLAGYTDGARGGIFAQRAAPVQVNYIGYPATMGAQYIDYIIADKIVIPDNTHHHYAEKVVYLPSFQANDSKREVAGRAFTRSELGLPPEGFVFCCFNNSYKITPDTFDSWMRILARVADSVLFLYDDTEAAGANLRAEATARGVAASRLIFGRRLPMPEYLARFQAADLFLDTNPFNAGTTASDALWAGLPVLTRTGESFAGRMATSLLSTLELRELITSTRADYEDLAVALATDPTRLACIKQKLGHNRRTAPLFNTALFAAHIEEAFRRMAERHRAGQAPDHIHVGP